MRIAAVYVNEQRAGKLTSDERGYRFEYDSDYRNMPQAKAISLTLPLRSEAYTSKLLFPFFDGLIPEGWLLDIAQKNWKLNPRDRMGLLLACCKDCIGNVRIEPIENDE